jgi:hypothetical protein
MEGLLDEYFYPAAFAVPLVRRGWEGAYLNGMGLIAYGFSGYVLCGIFGIKIRLKICENQTDILP